LQKGAALSLVVQTAAPGMVLRIAQIGPPRDERTSITVPRGQGTVAPPSSAERDAPSMPAAAARAAGTTGTTGIQVEAIVLRPAPGVTSSVMAGAGAEVDAAPPIAAGTRLSVRILTLEPAHPAPGASGGGPPPVALRPGAGQTITATLVRSDGAGRPLLASSAGSLVLATPVYLPAQWSGEIEILGVLPPSSADVRAAREETGSFRPATNWQTLEQILGVLSQSDPAAARHLRDAVLPQPTSGLAASLLKVLGLLRDGDVRGWIGDDAYQALARGRPDLLERLGADLRKLAPRPEGGAGGDWRSFTIPVAVDSTLATITMLIRNHPHPEEAAGAVDGASTRFVLDLALSRLGRMQIDGLLQAHGKQLDLIVRTDRPLEAAVQGGIRHVLGQAGAETGLQAAVCFHAAPTHFQGAVAHPGLTKRIWSSLVV
jgi:hypothetical protein